MGTQRLAMGTRHCMAESPTKQKVQMPELSMRVLHYQPLQRGMETQNNETAF